MSSGEHKGNSEAPMKTILRRMSTLITGETSFTLLQDLEAEIKNWIDTGHISKLEKLVLNGFGDFLVGVIDETKNKTSLKFLQTLPQYQEKIAAIHLAIENHDFTSVKRLINRQKLALARDRFGATPLHKAVLAEDRRIVSWLIHNYPEIVDAQDNNKRTPLHYAAALAAIGERKIYNFLLAAAADPEVIDCMGQTAKDYLEDQQLIKVLRHQHHRLSVNESKNIHSCIGLWLRDGCIAKLEQLILSGCGDLLAGRQSSNPLSQKFLQEVPQYLQRINSIHEAIRNNDLEALKISVTAKKWAIARNRKGLTPVHNAVLHKNSKILEFLVMTYPDVVNCSDYSLKTPLHYAAVYGKNNIFYRFLLAAGADPSVTDSDNHTPEFYTNNPIDLHLTVKRDHYVVSGSDFDLSSSEANDKVDPLVNELTEDVASTSQTDPSRRRSAAWKWRYRNSSIEFPLRVNLIKSLPQTENSRKYYRFVSIPLIKALTEVCLERPVNPIYYLATLLEEFTDNDDTLSEQELRYLDFWDDESSL